MRSAPAVERSAPLQATGPPEARGIARDEVRLLVSRSRGHEHAHFRDLPRFLPRGALLLVNRSATLPASLPAASDGIGEFRLSLSTRYGRSVWLTEPRWSAAKPGPLPLEEGDRIRVAGLPARLLRVYPGHARLWFVRIEGDVRAALRTRGEPIRYGYLEPPFPALAAYQTMFARVPGSAEMPSAARPFTPRVVSALRAAGIQIASILLHAGVSSLDMESERLDAQPVFPEPFRVPARTAAAVNEARWDGRAVIAVGTTVVRALASAWDGRFVRPAAGFTRRMVHPDRPARVVDGLITGLHDPHASHLALLHAVAGEEVVRAGYEEAVRGGYLWHEFGDSHLVLPGA